ncbi:uncharacterized protein LOC111412546, partial [Olea europaea subsp. europaea]
MDMRCDASSFLSSHPQFPLMSLHHFDMVEPIFPSMDRAESTRHLMKAAKVDQSRMMQQTVCHHRQSNWTFSISWGYFVHLYERIMPIDRCECCDVICVHGRKADVKFRECMTDEIIA